jgi:hypothetical protein
MEATMTWFGSAEKTTNSEPGEKEIQRIAVESGDVNVATKRVRRIPQAETTILAASSEHRAGWRKCCILNLPLGEIVEDCEAFPRIQRPELDRRVVRGRQKVRSVGMNRYICNEAFVTPKDTNFVEIGDADHFDHPIIGPRQQKA